MPQLIPHTLDDVADGSELRLGVVLRTRAATASQPSLFHVSGIAGIADARGVAALSNCQAGGGPEGPNAAEGVRTSHIAHDSEAPTP